MKKRYVETSIIYFDNDKYYSKDVMETDDYIKFAKDNNLHTNLYQMNCENNITTFTRKNAISTTTIRVWFE